MIALKRAVVALLLVIGAATAAYAVETYAEKEKREHWQQTIAKAREHLATAEQQLKDSQHAYNVMRHRRSMRGDEKKEVLDAQESAKLELERARQELDAAMAAARRDGAPPGWFRERQAPASPADR